MIGLNVPHLNVPPPAVDPPAGDQPAAGGGGAGDGNQHQDRLERQMARARQRLQARAESLDRLRQRQRELLYPGALGGPQMGLVSSAEMKTRRQNEMKKWSDENKSKYTSKVESVETMKDKEPASKVRQQAEKTLEKLKIALKSINKSAKYFETKEFRELIEPYLKLQSRLQSVVNSLDFNALDKELPFSKQKSATETAPTSGQPPLDRQAQIAADRELALSMSRSLNEEANHSNGSPVEQVPRTLDNRFARIREFHDKLEQDRQERVRRKQALDLSGPITKKRKLSGERREKKVKNWLEKQRNEQELDQSLLPSPKKSNLTKTKSSDGATESNPDIKTDPGRSAEPVVRLINLQQHQIRQALAAPMDVVPPIQIVPPVVAQIPANNTVKIEVGENQPVVAVENPPNQVQIILSDDDDVILSDIDFNMGPGPSGLNSKSGKNKK